MAEDPKEGQGDEGGEGLDDAQGGTGDKKPDQPTPDKSEDGDGGQKSSQPFPNLEAATTSYGNLLKKHQEVVAENKNLQQQKSSGGEEEGGDIDDAEIDRRIDERMSQRERASLARQAEANTRAFFRNNPEVTKDAETLAEMEAISNERPDLMQLEDPMAVIHALAEQRLGKSHETAAQKERESAERQEKNNEAKGKAKGHSHGSSQKPPPEEGDRLSAQELREMTPQERDAYAREHQFDE